MDSHENSWCHRLIITMEIAKKNPHWYFSNWNLSFVPLPSHTHVAKNSIFSPLCFHLVVCVSFLDAYFIYLASLSLCLSGLFCGLAVRLISDFIGHGDRSETHPLTFQHSRWNYHSCVSLSILYTYKHTYIYIYIRLFFSLRLSSSSSGSMNGLLQCVCTRVVLFEMPENISKTDTEKKGNKRSSVSLSRYHDA